jgi:hypothetical protein
VALEDKTIDFDRPVDEWVAAAITSRLEDGRLSCAAACDLAVELGTAPIHIGRSADQLQVRLTSCQLGLFGYPGHAKGWEPAGVASLPVPDGLEDALRSAAGDRSEVSCGRLWEEARRFSVPRIQVGWLADRLGLRVCECHLGAF